MSAVTDSHVLSALGKIAASLDTLVKWKAAEDAHKPFESWQVIDEYGYTWRSFKVPPTGDDAALSEGQRLVHMREVRG